jgi:DNA-binding protein YbaB
MGFFDKAKDMYAVQKQAKTVKKELKSIHIEAEVEGVKVVVTAEQEFVSLTISDSFWADIKNQEHGKRKLEEVTLKALNKAMKKAQEIASSKMKGVWSQLGVAQ